MTKEPTESCRSPDTAARVGAQTHGDPARGLERRLSSRGSSGAVRQTVRVGGEAVETVAMSQYEQIVIKDVQRLPLIVPTV